MKFTKTEYQQTLVDPVAFWKYILNEPFKLTPAQTAVFDAVGKYPETALIAGTKGGKSTLAAGASLWGIYRLLQLPDPRKKYGLNPGTNIYCMNIAPKEDLALNIILNFIEGFAEESWYLSEYLETRRKNEVVFVDNIIARGQGSSSRAGRGYFIYMLICDEWCHFRTTSGALSGNQVIAAYMPRLIPFREDGRFFGISTPAGRQGIAYEMFRTGKPIEPYIIQREETHGQQPFRAVFQIPTWELNPLYPRDCPFLIKEHARDAWNFDREYGALFADVVSTFFNPAQLESCIQYLKIPQEERTQKYVIVLTIGLKENTYGLIMAHKQGETIFIDLARRWVATAEAAVDVAEVEKYIVELCSRYAVSDVVINRKLGTPSVDRLIKQKVPVRGVAVPPDEEVGHYQNLLELINGNLIVFPRNPLLTNQLTFLERVEMANKYRVQASPGAFDDLARAVAHVAYVLNVEKRQTGVLLI